MAKPRNLVEILRKKTEKRMKVLKRLLKSHDKKSFFLLQDIRPKIR